MDSSDQSIFRACSLADLCEQGTFQRDHSAAYIEELFKETTGSNTDEK